VFPPLLQLRLSLLNSLISWAGANGFIVFGL
jgi:hypothetical protein